MALSISNLSVEIEGKSVLSDVSLSVDAGKITALLGANGAGKSELVLAVAGMLPMSKGSILADDIDLSNKGPDFIRRSGVAAVPEGHQVLTRLSVHDNLRAAGVGCDVDLEIELSKVYEVFPELAERRQQKAGTLSGGQQQMVALGHALMSGPKYLLLDEMSLGLAPQVVKRLMDVAQSLAGQGVGIILIEQFTDLALKIADDACILRGGNLCFSGSPLKLQSNPDVLKDAYFGG